MFVVVHHHASDPARFREITQAGGTLPPGVTLHQSLPTPDWETMVCLWEAESVAAVRDILEPALGDVSRNEYFEIDSAHAYGLPKASEATAGAAS
jgi:hypothetical protein